jgi:hypothetical protein
MAVVEALDVLDELMSNIMDVNRHAIKKPGFYATATALGVNPSSIATPFGVFPGCWQSRTTSALYSSVKITPLALLL